MQEIQDYACDSAQRMTTNVFTCTAFIPTLARNRYCPSVLLMKLWKDLFSAAGVGRDVCIICAGSAERKGQSGGSRKLLIEDGSKRLNPTIKLQHADQEPAGMLENISFQVAIVLKAVKYEMRTKSNTWLKWELSAAVCGHGLTQERDEFQHPPIKARLQYVNHPSRCK